MADAVQCNDPNPHGGHNWYGPGGSKQVQYWCPGVQGGGRDSLAVQDHCLRLIPDEMFGTGGSRYPWG